MDVREFIKDRVAAGDKQVDIAKKCGISQATIYKVLYTETELTLPTIKKIAAGYKKPLSDFIGEIAPPDWVVTAQKINDKERRLLEMFRNIDERRQDRVLEMVEDMALALRESFDRGKKDDDCEASNSGRK